MEWELYKTRLPRAIAIRSQKQHTLPSATTPFVFGSKSISYAYLNTVRTWFWRNDVTTMRFFLLSHNESFTAIAQLPDGTLVMGTSMGRLYVDGELPWIYVLQGQEEQLVSELLVLGRDHLILKTEDNRKFLVDLQNKNTVKQFGSGTEVCRFSDNKFASVCGKTCEVRHVSDDYSRSLSVKEECTGIRAEQEKFVLLRHGRFTNEFTIWLVEEQTHMLAPLQTYNYTNQFRRLIFISAQEFFVPNFAGDSQVRCQHYVYQVEANKWNCVNESEPAGKSKVTSMERIGASIMFVTEPQTEQGPVLYAFDMECKLIWRCLVRSRDWDSGSSNLVVLNSGIFAVRLSRSIYLFKPRKCRSRLFVGEGCFHYTEALINKHKYKHPFLARAITATDEHSRDWHFLDTKERMDRLKDRGVTVMLEIDAQQIHVHYRNKRFKRIHWNCPFGENRAYRLNYDFSKVVPAFFQSSRQIQKCGDRIHITLMQEKTQHGPTFWQARQKSNPIASGSHLAGYRLIKKRAFGEKRYPGYVHLSTSGHQKLISDDAEMREFVFEKISFDQQCVLTKKHNIIQDPDGFFLECDTDNDSSTYEDSSDDETGSNS